MSRELSNPFEEYRRMLREQSTRHSEALVPPSLFSLTSYLFVSILGRSDTMEGRDAMTFILGMLGKTSVSWSTYLLAMYYARRYTVAAVAVGGEATLPYIPIYVSAIICADKFLYDATYSNKDWSDFTRLPLPDINRSERQFLKTLNYDLHDSGFDHFLTHLDASLMLRQILMGVPHLLYGSPASHPINHLPNPFFFKPFCPSPLDVARMVYAIVLRSLIVYIVATACAVAVVAAIAVQVASQTSSALITVGP
ncbi:hypothetical protein BC829DRAFT_379041 [Chytridium lagenaria]|nr:hypothetical protein BC829DRAFT_379041 [Chytridium lagenaria]